MLLEVKRNESVFKAPCGKIGDARHLFQFILIYVSYRKDCKNGENHDFPFVLLVSV